MTNFATVAELAQRLDFDLDEKTTGIAQAALDDLSEDARFYGRPWPDPAVAPPMVKRLVLGAAQRFMSNYEGFITSRAGDETVTWTDLGEEAGSPRFIQREVNQLRSLGGRDAGFASASIFTYSKKNAPRDQYIRLETGDTMAYVAAEEAEYWRWDE